ncbi:Anaphase-promoting complex subunit CDC23 [Kluyveromyces marxianus]
MEQVVLEDAQSQLRQSSTDLSRWKLFQSAKWSSEALMGMCALNEEKPINAELSLVTEGDDESPLKKRQMLSSSGVLFDLGNIDKNADSLSECIPLVDKDFDLYLLASSLFDCKEFDRCAFFLKDAKHAGLKFLYLYSRYLLWDKKVTESTEDVMIKDPEVMSTDTSDSLKGTEFGRDSDSKNRTSSSFCNKDVDVGNGEKINLPKLYHEITEFLEESETQSKLETALLYYLLGIIQKKQGVPSSAMNSFLKSLKLYPYNWTCWCELLSCISRADESILLLKYLNDNFSMIKEDGIVHEHLMLRFFKLAIFKEFGGDFDKYIEELGDMMNLFPKFSFLRAQYALINYKYMDYANAEIVFDELVSMDPYRLDDLDTYSNVLYVLQKPYKLAYLAQYAANVDVYRPETCCIIANYFSSKQQHEKSILYFRRALMLDKSYTHAWILMGHEFIEMKNSHAAIECYRRAADVNPRDFQAWYGLGQAYEVLDKHSFALYYFQKACSLKPLDKRMWFASASCYEKLDKTMQAIKCFQRASQLSSEQDSAVLYRLAKLHEKNNDISVCKHYMIKCVELDELKKSHVADEIGKAKLWLAKHEFKHRNYQEAYTYANGVNNGTSQEIEEARAILAECRKRVEL